MMVARHFSAWYHATKRSVPSGRYDGLSEPKAAPYKNHQRGSRNLYSLDEFAFRLRYSARLASARFSSEIDFCSFAVLIASQNEPSIWVSSRHRSPRETHRGAVAVRHSTSALQIFRPLLLPRVSLQELRRYDPHGVKLRPSVLAKMARPVSNRLPENLLFRARSTEYLPRCHRKHCAPDRAKWIL